MNPEKNAGQLNIGSKIRNTADNLMHLRNSRSVDILILFFCHEWSIVLMQYTEESVVCQPPWVKSLEIREYYCLIRASTDIDFDCSLVGVKNDKLH